MSTGRCRLKRASWCFVADHDFRASAAVGAHDGSGLDKKLNLWTDPRGIAVGPRMRWRPRPRSASLRWSPLRLPRRRSGLSRLLDGKTTVAGVPRGSPPSSARSTAARSAVRGGLVASTHPSRIVETLGPDLGVVFRPVRDLARPRCHWPGPKATHVSSWPTSQQRPATPSPPADDEEARPQRTGVAETASWCFTSVPSRRSSRRQSATDRRTPWDSHLCGDDSFSAR